MHEIKKLAASAFISLLLAACGGSGSTSTNTSTTPANAIITTSDTVIAGIASKGPVDGTASVYALNVDGSRGALLKSCPVVKGNYSVNIGKFDVPVIIEVNGSYTDEATGKTIPLDKPLRTALSSSVTSTKVAVTPLTELAVQKAGILTPANIDSGNKLISDIFKVDIITTQPVEPAATPVSAASQSQKDYTLVLAAIAKLSETQAVPLGDTLKSLAIGISSSGMTPKTFDDFKKAVSDFKASGSNGTVFKDSNLAAINGAGTASFILAITGDFAANAISGIQFEVVIPPGLTIRADATSGVPLPEIVAESLLTVSAGVTISPWYNATDGVLHVGVATNSATSKGVGVGDLVTITCDIMPGYAKPPASAFSVRNIIAVDGTTAPISMTKDNVTVR